MRGGAGSGKSHFFAQKILSRIMAGYTNDCIHDFLVFRKERTSNKRSCYKLLEYYLNLWGLQDFCIINKTELSFNFSNGSTISCLGIDKPQKIKSIAKCSSVWLEEATELSLSDFEEIDTRLRGNQRSYKQIMMSFNPISKTNWIYKYFYTGKIHPSDITEVFSSYKDNHFIDLPYKKKLERYKLTNPNRYQIYTLGRWGILEGGIFSHQKYIQELPQKWDQEFYGIDFGFNNQTAIVHVRMHDKNLYVRELFYERHYTNSDLIEFLEENLSEDDEIRCDSSEPDRISEIRNAGFNCISADKGSDSVMAGIDFLKSNGLFITSDSRHLINEIENYAWKKKTDDSLKDEPVKEHDHLIDALRYAVNNGKPTREFYFF